MFRYTTSKQAIVIAAMVILLCLTCLTGATLALFTSNPEDGTIGIVTTAGKIAIDIEDLNGDSLLGDTLGWYQQDDVLFAPGMTVATEGFRIRNEGKIHINFRVYVSNDGSDDMEAFNQSFEVWIGTDPNDPESGRLMSDFVEYLEAETCSPNIYYVFVRMKPEAGDTYRGESYSGMGITVYAVQGNVNPNTMEQE